MKYTIILRRSVWLMEIFDSDADFYIANPDCDFNDVVRRVELDTLLPL